MKTPTYSEVVSRIVAAVGGGYVLANLGAIALYHALPTSHDSSLQLALLASFPVYAAAVVWSFAARTSARVWWGLGAPAAACVVVIALTGYAKLP